MKKILLLGATGHLGQVLLTSLLEKDYAVVALVRNPQKLTLQHTNLTIIKGNVTNENDLSSALNGVDCVMSTLGHGFRTAYPIQENTFRLLIPLMQKKKIQRVITITGAALLVEGDPKSFSARVLAFLFSLIDPYRLADAANQQQLLEKSGLNWTVVRTPVHRGGTSLAISHVGYSQPMPWVTITRKAIASFMIKSFEEGSYIQKSPIIS